MDLMTGEGDFGLFFLIFYLKGEKLGNMGRLELYIEPSGGLGLSGPHRLSIRLLYTSHKRC
jgi:hypothetical protein